MDTDLKGLIKEIGDRCVKAKHSESRADMMRKALYRGIALIKEDLEKLNT